MNNGTSRSTRELVTRQAGSLSLTLWHDGTTPAEHGGYRQRYAYRIVDATHPGSVPHDGRDLQSGAGADVDVITGMRTLVTFLSAAAHAYRYQMSHPGSAPENLGLFPAWVVEAAYLNSDELAMLALKLEHPNGPEVVDLATAVETPLVAPPGQEPDQAGARWSPGRYYTVIFLQDEEGHAVVDLLDEHGAEAAIEHLAQWDFGVETLEAALFNQDYHAEVPTYQGAREAHSGAYVLSYHPGLGTVHLLRQLPTESPAGWPDRYTGIRDAAGRAPAQPPPAGTHQRPPAEPQRTARPSSSRRGLDDGPSL